MAYTLYFSLFLTALVSGWHCALMCSGVAAWVETKVIRVVSPLRMRIEQLVMHLCRIITYTLLGAIAGGFGALFWRQDALPIQRGMYILASSLLILNAWFVIKNKQTASSFLSAWGLFQRFEGLIAGFWGEITRKLNLAGDLSWARRCLLGFIWGLIPCGLVYSVLPLAFLSGSALTGGLMMLALGLGTLPNLLLISGVIGHLAGKLAQLGHQSWMSWLVASLMLTAASLGLYRAFTLSSVFIKSGFCFN